MNDFDKLEYGESKEPWSEEEKTEQEGYKYIKYFIISAFVGYIILVIVMFAVPRLRYNSAKKKHEVSKTPSNTIIAFYFVNHIVCLCFIVSFIFQKKYTFMLALLTAFFWVFNIVFGFLNTINPGSTKFVSALPDYVNDVNKTKLMGYVYAYGYEVRRYRRNRKTRTEKVYGYSIPYVFLAHGSNFTIENFEIPDRNMFGYKFNFMNNEDTKSIDAIMDGETYIRRYSKIPNIKKIISGYYPDIKGVNFFSTTGKLSGIYGQAARVIAGIFGFGTYYDHTTSAIPLYSSTIHRDIAYDYSPTQEKQDFLEFEPDLEQYKSKSSKECSFSIYFLFDN